MTTTATTGRPVCKAPGNDAEESVLNVVGLYDDFAAGIRVRETFAWLSQMLAPGIKMRGKAWNFEMLARADFRPISIREAVNAHLLVVAGPGDRGLPAQVTSWLERCLSRSQTVPAALVGLGESGDGDEPDECLLYRDLGGFSERWGVEFIPGGELEARLDAATVRRIIDPEQQHSANPFLDRFALHLSEVPMGQVYHL